MESRTTNNNFWRTKQQQLLSMVVMLLCSTNVLWAEAANAGEDFSGYMQEMERREHQEHLYEAKLHRHEVWRQTTWAGYFVTQVQTIGKQFLPFLLAIQDALEESSDPDSTKGPTEIAIYLGIRMTFVILILMMVHALAKVVQLLIGTNYEVIQEVVIYHEHESEEEAARARATTSRGKKQKAS